MKSPMITRLLTPEGAANYSKLQIVKSNAGYFIGTIYTDPHDGLIEPGSRDSGYFDTLEEAEAFLKLVESGDPEAISKLRTHP